MKQEFTISNIDPLGQGVHRADGDVIFIPKTLPGESGICSILQQKKGVSFAKVDQLNILSKDRQHSPCPHFDHCPSCHFLHATYEKEIEFKTNSLRRIFNFAINEKTEVTNILATSRLHYRNRVQLHYDIKDNVLGMLDAKTSKIVSIPSCKIFHPAIQKRFDQLYQDEWVKMAMKQSTIKGHVELYWHNGVLKENWNKTYSDGEFTQVNAEMNEKLIGLVSKLITQFKPKNILELFAGNGNLSNQLVDCRVSRVDFYTQPMTDTEALQFIKQDLYKRDAVKATKQKLKKDFKADCLLLDPPRSGLKNLDEWANEFKPEYVLYVSCDPQTMARDIKSINGNYQLLELCMVDLFPSTYHFETVGLLQRTALASLP